MLRFVKTHVDALLRYHEIEPDNCIDVDYYTLVREPLATMGQLYQRLGMALPESVQHQLEAWLQDNPAGKRGEHSYRLQDFGLQRSRVEPEFAEYRAVFNIPLEEQCVRKPEIRGGEWDA